MYTLPMVEEVLEAPGAVAEAVDTVAAVENSPS